MAARIVAAIRYYWINRSQLTEGCYWLERALAVSEGASVEVRFKLLAGLGSFYRLRGDHARSRDHYQLALDEVTVNVRDDLVALATAGLGTVARLEGQIDDARDYFENALTLSRSVGDLRGISIALNCLADVMLHEGQRQDARECLVEALAIYRELGESEAECNNLNILGRMALEDSDDETAYEYYSQALAIARSLDNKIDTIDALIGFSAIACNSGNGELSAAFSGAADKLRDAIDYKLEPVVEAFQRTYLDRTRAVLNDRSFSSAIEIGRTAALSSMLDLTGRKLDDLLRPLTVHPHEIIIETRSTSTITIEEEN
jgi:tetratricopeptide (TPR) repeat protein